jgi:hypothetical protein
VCLDGASPAFGQPALTETPAFIFGISAPDARFLIGLEGVLKALFLN